MANVYKGIDLVTQNTYNSTDSNDRKGRLFFVRDDSDNDSAKIYFGNRQYSLSKNEIIDIINNALGNISTNSSKKNSEFFFN